MLSIAHPAIPACVLAQDNPSRAELSLQELLTFVSGQEATRSSTQDISTPANVSAVRSSFRKEKHTPPAFRV